MKLSKFQIIALILIALGWYFQGGGFSPKFVPDLKAEDVEARGVTGLLTLVSLSDDLKPVPDAISSPDPAIQVVPEEVVPIERKPRVIFLTQSIGCAPCVRVDTNVIIPLKSEENKAVGWTVGTETSNSVQIVDYNTNEELFFSWVEKINEKFNGGYRGNTPTFIRINKDGEIESYRSGEMSLAQFVKYQRGE